MCERERFPDRPDTVAAAGVNNSLSDLFTLSVYGSQSDIKRYGRAGRSGARVSTGTV